VWSYEVGSKSSLADNHVIVDASAYYIKWKDIQQNVPLTACGFQYTGNLGAAESKGFDIQTLWNATRGLSMGASFSYTDARFTQTVQLSPAVQSIVRSGDHLAASPWTAVVFGQWSMPVGSSSKAYLRADYQYSAQQTDLTANQNPLNGGYALWTPSIPAQSYSSLRAGLKYGGLDVSVFAQNLFDTRPRLTANQDIGTPDGGTPLFYIITWRPRTVGLTATFNY
jgi:outer membrane receptor protein involved in Fe transport